MLNISMVPAIADITVVFLAVLSIIVLLFAHKKLLNVLNEDSSFDFSLDSRYRFRQWVQDTEYRTGKK